MQAKLPVLACTDSNTDIGKVITDNGFGWWCESDDAEQFFQIVKQVLASDCSIIGSNSWKKLNQLYSVNDSYETILKAL